jgi:SAM-dependent methyltransferase
VRKPLTRNRTGWISERLTALDQQFIEFGALCPLPVLEIGAAYGLVSLAAASAGATVIANDLSAEHLAELAQRAQVALAPEASARLTCRPGAFPEELAFEDGSLGGIHCANVLHFFSGPRLERGLRTAARWLAPGGRLFLLGSTPFQAPFATFVPEFERRVAAGVRWPGWIEKVSVYSQHKMLGVMPRSLHLLDVNTLERALRAAGLTPLSLQYLRRPDLAESLMLDGRESVAAVAVR